MTSAISLTSPIAPANQNYYGCTWVNDLCKAVHEFVMKFFNALREWFNPLGSTGTTVTPVTTSTIPPGPRDLPSLGTPVTTTTILPGPRNLTSLGTPMTPNPRNLIPFYYGIEPNDNHVTLQQILNWDDGQLESVHNYIQWLFPLDTPSGPNTTAPVLDAATIQTFRADPFLKSRLLHSFRRMLTFYGLQLDEMTLVITRAANFNVRAAVWLTPADHNYHNFLRISRIIRSLGRLGLPEYSQAFLTIMQDIARNEGAAVVGDSLRHWQSAATSS